MEPTDIGRRKAEHLEVAASGAADFVRSTLLEDVHLVHQALPERALADVDLGVELVGKRLRAPLVVTGMTGGTGEAAAINRAIARAAGAVGVAFGVGSQRAMAEHPELEASFQVRDAAPDVVLFGNVGVVQAAAMGADRVAELAARIGADAMAIHLNPGQELIQARGDRDFTGALDTIRRVVDALGARGLPVLVKETGCGLSAQAAVALRGAGVDTVDVAGAGGTSWVAVEARRAVAGGDAAALGEELWDWGVPTAVATVAARAAGLTVIASGGIRSGLDVARALALGATAGGMAAPVLRAHQAGGEDGARQLLERVVTSVRTIVLLTGGGRAADLAAAPRHLGPTLRGWLDDLGLDAPGVARPGR
ncbi:MAG: type 2 isopentenyl-diphosphate Delta-isomerase [Kofleriaceae bacterium]|nr:type 2 isopentenyl-diphosphate Delta-isomerase [Kofleriaceae bacterium]